LFDFRGKNLAKQQKGYREEKWTLKGNGQRVEALIIDHAFRKDGNPGNVNTPRRGTERKVQKEMGRSTEGPCRIKPATENRAQARGKVRGSPVRQFKTAALGPNCRVLLKKGAKRAHWPEVYRAGEQCQRLLMKYY